MNVARLNVLITGDSKGAVAALAKAKAATAAYARFSNTTLLGSLKAAAAGFAALGAQAAAGGIVELTNALLPLIGTIGLLPGIAAAAGAAFGVVAIGVSGLGAAFKDMGGDQKKFAADLSALAPAAQHFVLAIKSLTPQLQALKASVQQSLFAGLGRTVKQLAATYLPMAQDALSALAATFNSAARQVAGFLESSATAKDLANILTEVRKGFADASAAAVPLVQVIRDVTAVSAEFLPSLGTGLADVAKKLSSFISQARQSGALHDFIADGITAARQLGGVLANVGGIVHSVFAAAPGAGLLGTIKAATGALNDFLKTTQGKADLTEFFSSAGQAAKLLEGLLPGVLSSVAGLSKLLVQLATAAAPGLTAFVNQLAQSIGTLGPAASALGSALGQVMSNVAGVLPDVAATFTALVQAAAPLLVTFSKIAAALVKALAPAVQAVLPALSDAIGSIGDAVASSLPALAPAFAAIAQAIAQVAPVAGQLIAQLITGLAPILAQLVTAVLPPLTQLLLALAPVFSQVIGVVLQVAQALAPLIVQLVQELAPILVQLMPSLGGLVAAFANVLAAVLPVLGPLVQLAGPVLGAVASALGLVIGGLTMLVNTWAGVFRSLSAEFGPLFSGIADAVAGVATGFTDLVNNLGDVPSAVAGVFADAGTWLYDAGRWIVQGLVNGLESMAGAPVDMLKNVGSSMVDGFTGFFGIHSPSRLMHEMGGYVMAGLAGELSGGMPMVGAQWSDVNDLLSLKSPTFSPANIIGSATSAAPAQTTASAAATGTVQITIDLRGTSADAAQANAQAATSALSDLFSSGTVTVTQLRGRS